MDRDHAAALVILSKAVAGLGADNVTRWGERRLGNIVLEEIPNEALSTQSCQLALVQRLMGFEARNIGDVA